MGKWITGLLLVALLVTGAGEPAFATGTTSGRDGVMEPGSWNTALQARLDQPLDSNYLIVLANGPVDLLVTDPQGRRVVDNPPGSGSYPGDGTVPDYSARISTIRGLEGFAGQEKFSTEKYHDYIPTGVELMRWVARVLTGADYPPDPSR